MGCRCEAGSTGGDSVKTDVTGGGSTGQYKDKEPHETVLSDLTLFMNNFCKSH